MLSLVSSRVLFRPVVPVSWFSRSRLSSSLATVIGVVYSHFGSDFRCWSGPVVARNASDELYPLVITGFSRSKNGGASARLCPVIHVFSRFLGDKGVDGRVKPGHDECFCIDISIPPNSDLCNSSTLGVI